MKFKHLLLLSALAVSAAQAATTFVPGYLKYEYFPGAVRADVETGGLTPSTGGTVIGSDKGGDIPSFRAGNGFADNYVNRVTGFFIPPKDGDYVFFVASDDDSDLFLSTDDTTANKKLIAQEQGWSNEAQWTTTPSGDVTAKRSDQFTASEWGTTNITLKAGQKYYIEGVHHEGTGGDNFSATYKLASDPDPKDGTPTLLRGSVIGVNADTNPPAPNLKIDAQPIGGTFYPNNGGVVLTVLAQSDSTYPIAYQWRKNGTNIAGANSATFTIGTPTNTDNGNYDVVVSVPGTTGAPTTLTSSAAAVTAATPTALFSPGFLKYDYFPGSDRPTVEAGGGTASFTGTTLGSDLSGFVTTWESGVNFADNYANRFSGFFVPPADGNYVFFVASDDDSDLFLSTDDTSANKKLIAQEASWSNNREWITAGFGDATLKRSDQFANTQWPDGATITLKKGQKYYIEGVHHEGGGGDDFSATYKLDTDPDPADGTPTLFTGPVIGVNIPQIISVNGINPRYDKFTFNVSDVGPSVLNASSVKLFIDGQPVTLTATPKTTNGVSTFSYVYPAAFAQGSTHSYTVQASDTTGQPLTITSLYTIPFQTFPKTDLNGPAPVDKAWAVRWIWGVTDTNGNVIANTDLNSALKTVAQVGSSNFLGQFFDTTNKVINYNASGSAGFIGGDNPYPDEVINGTGWTGDNFIVVGIGHIVIPEESDYTFAFHSDDGAALRIRGGQAISASGSGFVDPVDPEVILEPAPTGDSNTRGVYHLKKGVYRIEFVWYENGGGDNGELYAAKGAFVNDADTTNWRLVGDNTAPETLTLLGVDTNGWTVISSDPNGATQLLTWADADAALAATGGGAKEYDVLNVGDPNTNPGVQPFPKNTPADDNDYTLKATATLVVPADGTYLIGFDTDDGGRVQVVGQTFESIIENLTGASVISGDTVTCDITTGDSGTTATITLKKGNYQIVAGEFERSGGSALRVSGASLPVGPVNANQIPALAKGVAGTSFTTITALQLTSAPTGIDNGGTNGAPAITIARSGNTLTLSWAPSGGTLQSTTALTGATTAWTDVGTTNPAIITVGPTGSKFYRIKQ